jgi:hypothetical protein
MRQIWLVRPVENRPQIPLKYCALCRVADLALGVSAKEFTRQSERPCARFAV